MRAVLAAFLIIGAALPAQALNKCHIQPVATDAALQSLNSKDCVIGYSLDEDNYYARSASSWDIIIKGAAQAITGVTTLDETACGKSFFITAAADDDLITLPALSSVPAGCRYEFFYTGADAGAKVEISPNASDGIEGSCTLAGSVVNFSGTDDADINLTKETSLTGDTITLVSGDASDWYVSSCTGIWANP